MSQLNRGPIPQSSGSAVNNVYTVLAAIAAVALAAGVVYVWFRAAELFGTSNPFELVTG